jgi:hypothetical protein
MTAARRLRVLRLRTIEHHLAAARLARADVAIGNLTAIETRVERLRHSTATTHGETTGLALQSLAELAQRLDRASEGLAVSRANADTERAERAEDRRAAHMAEERIGRLHANAQAAETRAKALRIDATRIWRKRSARAS